MMLTPSATFRVVLCSGSAGGGGDGGSVDRGFPSFLPQEIERVRDRAARRMARRIARLPVKTSISEKCIMSSCVKPLKRNSDKPVVLLHGFDSSCLEWRYTLPLLENAGLETWAIDVLGWGFSDLEQLPPCNVATKREHLYQFWRSYVRRPMLLVGPSLGAAVAIDFAVTHPEAVSELVLIDASVYAEGTGNLSRLPRSMAYAGVSLLKSMPLRLIASLGTYGKSSLSTIIDRTTVGILHCLLPWWEDATVNFMLTGGYNVVSYIKQVEQKTLIVWGEDDRIISRKFAYELHRGMYPIRYDGRTHLSQHCTWQSMIHRFRVFGDLISMLRQELRKSSLSIIPDCGHIPHIEKPKAVAKLIVDFARQKDKLLAVAPIKQRLKPKANIYRTHLDTPVYRL